MCRKTELIGSCMMAVGVGMLLSLMFSSDFAMALIGIAFVLGGFFYARRL